MYPPVNVYITMENHHAINGKIHYKLPFSIAMLVYQRVFVSCVLLRSSSSCAATDLLYSQLVGGDWNMAGL